MGAGVVNLSVAADGYDQIRMASRRPASRKWTVGKGGLPTTCRLLQVDINLVGVSGLELVTFCIHDRRSTDQAWAETLLSVELQVVTF